MVNSYAFAHAAISVSSSGIRSKISRCQTRTGRDHPLPAWPTFPPDHLCACFRVTRLSGCWRSTGFTKRPNIENLRVGAVRYNVTSKPARRLSTALRSALSIRQNRGRVHRDISVPALVDRSLAA